MGVHSTYRTNQSTNDVTSVIKSRAFCLFPLLPSKLSQFVLKLNKSVGNVRNPIPRTNNKQTQFSPTISVKSPWDTLRQIVFSLSFDTYKRVCLRIIRLNAPPPPPKKKKEKKQGCFVRKYVCVLKTTSIWGRREK